jgi:hypothetical protein
MAPWYRRGLTCAALLSAAACQQILGLSEVLDGAASAPTAAGGGGASSSSSSAGGRGGGGQGAGIAVPGFVLPDSTDDTSDVFIRSLTVEPGPAA